MRSRRRAGGVALGVTAAAVTLALGPVIARAVSGGGYSYQQQGCSASANRNDAGTNGVPQTEPGCHNFTLQLNQGGGSYTRQWHPFSFNLDQLPNDNSSPHAGSIVVDPGRGTAYTVTFDTGTAHTLGFFPLGYVADAAGWVASTIQTRRLSRPPLPGVGHPKVGKPTVTGPTPGKGGHGPDPRHPDAQLYIGADDNLDNGEHDGVNPTVYGSAPVANGPSDGGATQVNVHPQGDPRHPASIGQNVAPRDGHNPVRAADAAMGACADGLCFAVETRRRLAYHGGCYNGTSCPDRNVYSDESSTNWRNQDCNSGTAWNQNECGSGGNAPSCTSTDRDGPNGDPAGTTDCDDGSISQPYNERGGYYTEPGVQVYEDPDPQSSPILPRPFYPVPEEYAGTQGVYVNGRPVVTPPSDGAGRHGQPARPAPAPPPPPPAAAPLSHPATQTATAALPTGTLHF